MNRLQELLLGEQTPSPSLSRSSSVSSVLMVSNVAFVSVIIIFIIIDYFQISMLNKYYPISSVLMVTNVTFVSVIVVLVLFSIIQHHLCIWSATLLLSVLLSFSSKLIIFIYPCWPNIIPHQPSKNAQNLKSSVGPEHPPLFQPKYAWFSLIFSSLLKI